MVLWLAEKFLAEGKNVAILSRGYRGRRGSSDEIELLKRRLGERVLFGVGSDRFSCGAAWNRSMASMCSVRRRLSASAARPRFGYRYA